MKFNNIRAFEKHLLDAKPNHFSNLYLVIVEDPFVCKTLTDRLVEALAEDLKNRELSVKRYEGRFVVEKQLLSELNELSFFSEKQIFRIDEADTLPKSTQKLLEDLFVQLNKGVYLVLSASSFNRTTNFYKKAEKAGIVLELEEEKGASKERNAIEWGSRSVEKLGKKIVPQAMQMLVKQLGSDIGLLQNEIEKLVCYIGDREEITVADIKAICIHVNAENIWQLIDAIFSKNAPTALRILNALLKEEALIALIRQIRNQFQTDFQICSILSSGGTAADVMQAFPRFKGFILDKRISSSTSYGLERFKQAMKLIDETEFQAKNNYGHDELLAEKLIISLVS